MKDALTDAMNIMTLTTFAKVFGDTDMDEFFLEMKVMLYSKYEPGHVDHVVATLAGDVEICIEHFKRRSKMKRDGGTIDHWQIHNLSHTQETIDGVYPGENLKPMVFTGTNVSENGVGKWMAGDHMRSSLIVNIDRENGTIETRNTIYKVLTEGGDETSENMAKLLGKDSPDLGDGVMGIFY